MANIIDFPQYRQAQVPIQSSEQSIVVLSNQTSASIIKEIVLSQDNIDVLLIKDSDYTVQYDNSTHNISINRLSNDNTWENCTLKVFYHLPEDHIASNTTTNIKNAASCTTNAIYYQTCSICGEVLETTWTKPNSALGHSWNEGQVTTAPSCQGAGVVTKTCDSCGATITQSTSAAGHTSVTDAAVAPTCTETGLTEGAHCSVCNAILSAQETVPALGHNLTLHSATSATEQNSGNTAYYSCSRCGKYFSDSNGTTEIAQNSWVIPALNDNENISFSYEAKGINNSQYTVNSGYIYLDIYMNVNSSEAHLKSLNIDLDYDEVNLTPVSYNNYIFENVQVSKTQNGLLYAHQSKGESEGDDIFEQGQYLILSLVFKVDKDFYNETTSFDVLMSCSIGRNYISKNIDIDYGTGTQINVKMLGDADENGRINSTDIMKLSQWCAAAGEDDYEAVFDMNKDGFIDEDDVDLLRGAASHRTDHLHTQKTLTIDIDSEQNLKQSTDSYSNSEIELITNTGLYILPNSISTTRISQINSIVSDQEIPLVEDSDYTLSLVTLTTNSRKKVLQIKKPDNSAITGTTLKIYYD